MLINQLVDCSSLDLVDQNLCDGGFDPTTLIDDVEELYGDNCDASVSATVTGTTPQMGNTDCSWSYTYEYTIVDNCMNATTCEVTVSGGDTEEPMLVNPLVDCSSLDLEDQNLCNGGFDPTTLIDDVEELYGDNCDASVLATVTGTIPGMGNT